MLDTQLYRVAGSENVPVLKAFSSKFPQGLRVTAFTSILRRSDTISAGHPPEFIPFLPLLCGNTFYFINQTWILIDLLSLNLNLLVFPLLWFLLGSYFLPHRYLVHVYIVDDPYG